MLDARARSPAIGDSSRRTLISADLELMLEQREHVADDRVEIDRASARRPACPDATASAAR